MVSRTIKMLALFTLLVGFMEIILNWAFPLDLPTIRRVNQHRRHLKSKIENHRGGSEHKISTEKEQEARTKLMFFYTGKISWIRTYKSQKNIADYLRGSTRTFNETDSKDKLIKKVFCPDMQRYLGPTNWKMVAKPTVIDQVFSLMDNGGSYKPFDCVPTDAVAVIVPFSGQGEPILSFLFSLHLFLLTQLVEYQLFVVKEHSNAGSFKPGMLSNIGFVEAQKMRPDINFTCVVFHDPYLAPADSNNLYRCSDHPKQLVASIDNISYKHELGGVIAIRPEDFRTVNGFSNLYTDSESVYLDMYDRILAANFTIVKPPAQYARYNSLLALKPKDPPTKKPSPVTIPIAASTTTIMFGDDDGLASLSTLPYLVQISKAKSTYTLIEVQFSPSEAMTKSFENAAINDESSTVTPTNTAFTADS